ncbi:MAG TPA: hypothetical protein VIJ60_07765, partial [Acidimicrobiales bacterium]
MAELPESATYTVPPGSHASPEGSRNRATAPGPSTNPSASPTLKAMPATVVTTPLASSTRR